MSWQEEPANLQPESLDAWQGSVIGHDLQMSGPCPVCGHDVSVVLAPSTLITTSAAHSDSARFEAARYFECNCGSTHPSRPDTRGSGCGAYWVGRPRYHPATGEYSVDIVTQPQSVAAAILVEENERATSHGIRSLAEKWIPGIAAVTGTLGLAAVVVAKDSVAELDRGWRIGAFLLVVGAVSAAGAATVVAYRAAYGWPQRLPLTSDDDLLRAAEKIRSHADKVASRLKAAVGLSCVSLLALVVTLGIFWIEPTPRFAFSVTYTADGRTATTVVLCGEFLGVDGGAFRLSVKDGPRVTTEAIPLSSITEIETVPKCEG